MSSSPRHNIASMTGFARSQGAFGRLSWTWEIKSVNAKGLDLRARLPSGFDALDGPVRAGVSRRFKRGNITVSLNYKRATANGEAASLKVNRELLDEILSIAEELAGSERIERPRLDALLAVRGVVELAEEAEEGEEERAAREAAMADTLAEALTALAENRAREGGVLAEALSRHVDQIETLTGEADGLAAMAPDAIKARLREQIAELLDATPALSEDRLAAEAALLSTKADIREELDRLHAHVDAARALLSAGGPVGRKLEFLCQEFNREANTLCSKSFDVELTRIGLDLKVAIDQLREQVQNIE